MELWREWGAVGDDRAMRMRGLVAGMVLVVGLGAACVGARGQSSEADVSARLVGKPLFLRRLCAEDKLKFDAAGQPKGSCTAVSFTVAGINVEKVRVSGDKLRVEGQRMGLEFDRKEAMTRVPMKVGKFDSRSLEKMMVDIDLHGGHDFGPALDAVFSDLAGLVPKMPEFWQGYAVKHFLPKDEAVSADATVAPKAKVARGEGPMHIGGSVTPPRVVRSADPEFSEGARQMKYAANVQVYMWVDANGVPSHLGIVRPAGMGLDEKAIQAVSAYVFQPAMQGGKARTVDLYIEVNFQIF